MHFLDCLSHKSTHCHFFLNCHRTKMSHLNHMCLSEHINEYNMLNLYKYIWIHPKSHCFLLSGWMLLVSAALPLHNTTWGVWLAASGPLSAWCVSHVCLCFIWVSFKITHTWHIHIGFVCVYFEFALVAHGGLKMVLNQHIVNPKTSWTQAAGLNWPESPLDFTWAPLIMYIWLNDSNCL